MRLVDGTGTSGKKKLDTIRSKEAVGEVEVSAFCCAEVDGDTFLLRRTWP